MDIEGEAQELTSLLAGKTIRAVKRLRPNEVVIEFVDGTRLFADAPSEQLDFSVTDSPVEHAS